MVSVLNANIAATDTKVNAVEISRTLQRLMLRLKGKFMEEDGRSVDYKSFAESDDYSEYCNLAAQLGHVVVDDMNSDEALAFWINIYNALTIHALVNAKTAQGGTVSSVLDVSKFWATMAYNVGGHILTLDDIEHGIIRGNKAHPSSKKVCFEEDDDARKHLALKSLDPRIHFALVCGAKSCPPIRVYSPENLDSALHLAARSFIQSEVQVNPEGNQVTMSKIFMWYGSDFAESSVDVVRWCMNELEECDLKTKLQQFLLSTGGQDIQYSDYDWKLNTIHN